MDLESDRVINLIPLSDKPALLPAKHYIRLAVRLAVAVSKDDAVLEALNEINPRRESSLDVNRPAQPVVDGLVVAPNPAEAAQRLEESQLLQKFS